MKVCNIRCRRREETDTGRQRGEDDDEEEEDDGASFLPLLCEEKQSESWANRSGFSNFSSLTLIQKQFSDISWGTICNDTRIPLSQQSEREPFPLSCHSKKKLLAGDELYISVWIRLYVCEGIHTSLELVSSALMWTMGRRNQKKKKCNKSSNELKVICIQSNND